MDYSSARPFHDYDRQQERIQPYPQTTDPPNPYSLDFPSDLYNMNSSYPSSIPPQLSHQKSNDPYASSPSYAIPDRRQQYQPDFQEEFPLNSIPYPHQQIPSYSDRVPYPQDRYANGAPTQPPQIPTNDYRTAAPPQNTSTYTAEPDLQPNFDEMSRFVSQQSHQDMPVSVPPAEDPLSRVKLGVPALGASTDFHSYLSPYLEQYVRTTNRLAFGERTVIVFSSKVAQKSYGTEKRFICPPPTAILIGNSWWAEVRKRGEEVKLRPPRVVVSISGESSPPEATIEWTGASGKSFDVNDPPGATTYVGRCVGKQLFISDVDDKKKKVEALVKICAPGPDEEPEHVIGIFPSRPIKVISKPSKKRQSAKNLELCINHGATIALFHRLRSQTVSTKYLCVSGSGSAFKGSDDAPLIGLEQRTRTATPSFIARTASWDPFVMYIVDITKPAGGVDAPPPPPPHQGYPSPPPNAIPLGTTSMPIYYNQTVVLQCLTSGVVSPVLIIRKVDQQTTAVGGGLLPKAKGVPQLYCAPGEVCGDPVSQLHKIAFEVYDQNKIQDKPGTPGLTGAFLSCMGEKVNTYRPIEGRQWSPGSHQRMPSPHGSGDGSAPGSPSSADFPSNDGGRVKKTKSADQSRATSQRGRRRTGSAGSIGSRREANSDAPTAANGATWYVDVGETSVWTVVGTDQVRYNFYVPPALFNQPHPPLGAFPVPSKPLTPFPNVVKCLPPERMNEGPRGHNIPASALAQKQLTLYGENFDKNNPVHVYFGTEPSSHVEVRCPEVIGCAPPSDQPRKRPLLLVRNDGIVFPSSVMYP